MKYLLFTVALAAPFSAWANEKVETFKKLKHFKSATGSWSVEVTYAPSSKNELKLMAQTYDNLINSSNDPELKEANQKLKKEAIQLAKKESKSVFDVLLSGRRLSKWKYYQKSSIKDSNIYAEFTSAGMGVRIDESMMNLVVTDDSSKLLLDLNKVTTLSLRLNEALKGDIKHKVIPVVDGRIRIEFDSKGYTHSYTLNKESTSVTEFSLTQGEVLKSQIKLDEKVWKSVLYREGKVYQSETWTPCSPLAKFDYKLGKHTHSLYRCSAVVSSINTEDLSIDDALQLLGKEDDE